MPESSPARLSLPEFHGQVGVATRDITPPVGIYSRTWGSALHDKAEGVHRPFIARCMVFRSLSGDAEQVIVTLDALVFWPLAAEKIRAAVEERFGLRSEQISFHPSHSHSAPFLAERQLGKPGGDLIVPYLDRMPGICCELVAEARASLKESILTWTYGRCSMAFNRDAIDAASGRDICGLNLLEKADDTVLVGRVTDMSGRITATIVNYACHPVSLGGGNRLLSPDYIGAMRETMEKETGGAPCLFFHGASGDTTPRRSYEANVEAADQNGRELGYAALAALTSMFPPGQELRYIGIEESGTPLGVWRLTPKDTISTKLSARRVMTNLRLKDMPTRAEIQQKMAVATERFEIERLERALANRDLIGDATEHQFAFMLWQLGDSFIVSTPAEAYNRFQIDLRKQFPDTTVAVLNLSDGTTTYLPKATSFGRDVYQVRIAFYDASALDRVTSAAVEAIAEAR